MLQVIPALLLAGLAGAQQQTPGRDANVSSTGKEVALASELANEFRRNSAVLESSAAQQYVERLGRQLAPYYPDQSPLTYSFSIIADTGDPYLHEPCAFPGGYVFVPAALFFAAQDEAEFAGMLAHAMAHVAAGHGTRLARRGQIANLASIPLVFMGGLSGSCRDPKLLMPLGYLKFARENELDADQLAVQAMARAGYDPAALVGYVRREQIETEGKASTLSPLPPREDRLKLLDAAIATLPPRPYSQGSEFVRVKQEVRAIANNLQSGRKRPSLQH